MDAAELYRCVETRTILGNQMGEILNVTFGRKRSARLVKAAVPLTLAMAALHAPSQSTANDVEEVIVTAQKRSERIQDIPIPVTALDADRLVETNKLRIQDYYATVPGLSVTPGLQSSQALSIRGISTGSTFNPTVGITIDDVPYGASAANAGGNVVPDIDPGDLVSIEVLRGPQGALYGASSMGGLVKFVTVDPSTEYFGGRVQVGSSYASDGEDYGYNVRGSVNIPVNESFALRASGFTRRDPGYIDNVLTGEKDINQTDVQGGRLSALWRPSESFSLKLSALAQRTEAQGLASVSELPGLGEWQQSYVRGAGKSDNELQAYSATASARLGIFELTSLTGYNINEPSDSLDSSAFFGAFGDMLYGAPSALGPEELEFKKFTQELRLSAPVTDKLDWRIGAFYTRESSRWEQRIDAIAEDGSVAGNLISDVFPTTYKEYAAFTDFTFHVTDRFDLQVGGRQSEIRQTYQDTLTGPLYEAFGIPTPIIVPKLETKSDAFTYLLTPSFKIHPDLMAYARFASGYRAGGTNSGFNVPPDYDPDKTKNYEIGMKGFFLNRRISLDASIFHIDWKNIQIAQINYVANAPRARSRGVELSLETRPLDDVILSGWIVWNDAELTEDFPAGASVGRTGDRLPSSSRISGNLSVQKNFAAGNDIEGFVSAAVSYVGDRKGVFTATAERQELPSYAKVDLNGGITYSDWSVNLFISNLANRYGVISGGMGNLLDPTGFYYIPPRTIGMSVAKSF